MKKPLSSSHGYVLLLIVLSHILTRIDVIFSGLRFSANLMSLPGFGNTAMSISLRQSGTLVFSNDMFANLVIIGMSGFCSFFSNSRYDAHLVFGPRIFHCIDGFPYFVFHSFSHFSSSVLTILLGKNLY